MPSIEIVAAVLFAIALLHTFATRLRTSLATRFPRHEGLFHLLGEVEVVFGFWAMVLVLAMALAAAAAPALAYVESRNYTEPLFVFVIMVIAPRTRAGDGPLGDRPLRAAAAAARRGHGLARAGRWCRCWARWSPSRPR